MRDIQAQLQEIFGVEVSAGLISEWRQVAKVAFCKFNHEPSTLPDNI